MGMHRLNPGRSSKTWVLALILFLPGISDTAFTHDIITTPVTWNREISRIFYSRCVSCHRSGGTAFPMTEYQQTFPWRTAIKEEILERRMPPWGAVKGFGDFRNDQAFTPEQLELVTSWSQGGSPEGEAKDLPSQDKLDEMMKESLWHGDGARIVHQRGEIVAKGDLKLTKRFVLDGLFPQNVPEDGSFQIIAEFPPAGTLITGIPAGSTVTLVLAQKN
jgi:hypothetical protein